MNNLLQTCSTNIISGISLREEFENYWDKFKNPISKSKCSLYSRNLFKIWLWRLNIIEYFWSNKSPRIVVKIILVKIFYSGYIWISLKFLSKVEKIYLKATFSISYSTGEIIWRKFTKFCVIEVVTTGPVGPHGPLRTIRKFDRGYSHWQKPNRTLLGFKIFLLAFFLYLTDFRLKRKLLISIIIFDKSL